MKDENWLDMVKKQGELRHFGSLAIRKTQKGNQISAQEIDFLSGWHLQRTYDTGTACDGNGVSKTIISRLTEQLERKKFISKERDEIDRRSYVIRVTDSGKEEIDRMYYYYMNPLYELKEKMSELQFRQLFELIEEANNILS